MHIAVLGIDLGKNSCSVAGLDDTGRVVVRRRLRRENIVKFTASLAPCLVAMEACCGAHHLGRILRAQGHQVRLMSPEYVRPYVKAHKNDDRDAEGIAEAATRPTMRFVELKSEEQLDMQTLHRARDRLVSERTALINQLRAVLSAALSSRKGGASWSSISRRCWTRAVTFLLVRGCGRWLRTCGPSGANSTSAFALSTMSLPDWPGPTRPPVV
jgi:transposase